MTSAIENIRKQDVKGVKDLKELEKTIHGMEFKPLPFMLCVTNLILHDIEVPNVDYTDSLTLPALIHFLIALWESFPTKLYPYEVRS